MVEIRSNTADYLEILGGESLKGTVEISGAKNSALPDMAATILTDETVVLENVPDLLDVFTMRSLLNHIGMEVDELRKGVFQFRLRDINSLEAPYELVSKMRASILVLGAVLTRFRYAKVALPGGCSIGTRPVDLHLEALKKMGARIKVEHGYIYAEAPGGLEGAEINFPKITVTGTENIMMAAVLAKGRTVINNAAREPEVVDLADMLKKMGADIEGEGTERIVINGVEKLSGTVHRIIPDRIEAGTFAILSALFDGNITIKNYPVEYLEYVHRVFERIGIKIIQIGENHIAVKREGRLKPVFVETKEYPYFPTDLQAQLMTLLTVVDGNSKITENIFENRFMHVPELQRLGAKIKIDGRTAYIKGVRRLTGAEVRATDLRASAAMVIAGLIAEGKTVIYDIYHLDRGYENIDQKLRMLGARITRESL
ncbi:MAG TPA: UDP-N-acetylglucosamine 1-carboxyvinyltransferase [Persephonella sp.]|uniref:UDP-N-acetylglucosamine 1-carboxyvinyltransferase n=1 Tax=Persephonella marina (strain DSM 14350 / EX-H1) TaxID=123214 RepID=C0QT72_PERMH|nr:MULTISPECIES: UDP-N-acetylglucosamine 1-carboxyvinyltransferase [Persephonella]ACO03073.1 UDP-N-acetylglucosamine 1-carboxyvinyltransferase [Persephonella marina EX-H1]HCB70494.1 UDP-N-acetylglucosamine 1-carboxyvinyltransferase [Persephonella sp.]